MALAACGHHDDPTIKLDAATATDDSGRQIDAGSSGTVTGQAINCYSQGNPTATCTIPTHCCFSNFSAQHDGSCGTSACGWGTIECDGPEDCSDGGHCCSTQLTDPNGVIGYRIACQVGTCGPTPAHEELCHANGPACANGGTCITAYGNNNDLPRTLAICR
jgi:hypothetical protein